MATEATQAAPTTTAPLTTEATPQATSAPITPPVAPTPAAPKLGAQERAAAALAKVQAALDAKAKTTAETLTTETTPSTETAKPEGEQPKPPEAEKKPEEKVPESLSRAIAVIAQKDREIAKRDAALRESQANHERTIAADKADLDFVRKVREAHAKDGKLGVLRMFAPGISMNEIVEWQSKQGEPDPREIAREVAQAELKAAEEARKAEAEKAKAEAAEREKAADIAEGSDFCARAGAVLEADKAKYHYLSFNLQNGRTTPEQFWAFTKNLRSQLGRSPTPQEALDGANKAIKDYYEALKPVEPPPAAPPPAQAQPKQPEKAPDKQPPRAPAKRESAIERAKRLARERQIA